MLLFFFFNDTATTEIYTLSLHDALPICSRKEILRHAADQVAHSCVPAQRHEVLGHAAIGTKPRLFRSEEHTSELQSQSNLVCRLLLEKKKRALPPHKACRYRRADGLPSL